MMVWEDKIRVHYVTMSSMVLEQVEKSVPSSIAWLSLGTLGRHFSTLGFMIVGITGASPS